MIIEKNNKSAIKLCLIVCVLYCKLIVFLFRCNEIVLVQYQLLFDFRQGVRENLTKAQWVRVG